MLSFSGRKYKSAAIIPFFNENETLNEVLLETLKYVDYIIAIDDGSNDGYNEILDDRIIYLKHKRNLGKGAALKTAFEYIIDKDFDYIVTLDADYQHPPKYITRFLEMLLSQKIDLAIGNRMKFNKMMPFHRKMSNLITSFILSIKLNLNIPDSQNGFRAYKSKIIKNLIPKYSGFEAETEILIKAAKLDYKFGFTEIPALYPVNNNSKMRSLKTILGFIKVIFLE